MRHVNKLTRDMIRKAGGLDQDGKLPACAWPGGYQLIYFDSRMDCLCPGCADKERKSWDTLDRPIMVDVLYEGREHCSRCDREIVGSYEDD